MLTLLWKNPHWLQYLKTWHQPLASLTLRISPILTQISSHRRPRPLLVHLADIYIFFFSSSCYVIGFTLTNQKLWLFFLIQLLLSCIKHIILVLHCLFNHSVFIIELFHRLQVVIIELAPIIIVLNHSSIFLFNFLTAILNLSLSSVHCLWRDCASCNWWCRRIMWACLRFRQITRFDFNWATVSLTVLNYTLL